MGMISTFITLFVLFFGLFTLIAGLLTAYFGSGRSRAIGGVMTLMGLIITGLFFIAKYNIMEINYLTAITRDVYLGDALFGVLGAVIGGVLALVIFLIAIIKS